MRGAKESAGAALVNLESFIDSLFFSINDPTYL